VGLIFVSVKIGAAILSFCEIWRRNMTLLFTVVKPIQNICGEAISSTLIRESLKKGDLSKASKHLGYYVKLHGRCGTWGGAW